MENILTIENLHASYTLRGRQLPVLRGITLNVKRGETLCLVGESGCGKSALAKCIMGLLDANGSITQGSIRCQGRELTKLSERERQTVRGREIAMVLQDPLTSLNPLVAVGAQIARAARLHRPQLTGAQAKLEAMRLLEEVGIRDPARAYRCFPHEFSGGMRQRAVIAVALACKPQILICDEPTTALDVTVQSQILSLLAELKRAHGLTVIFITHDLAVAANIADTVAVMYAGQIVECAPAKKLFGSPRHPYTWALLCALPENARKGQRLFAIEGAPPGLFEEIKGDAFARRSRYALNIDFTAEPPVYEVSPGHFVKSWLADPKAPKVTPPIRL